jgi:hypothetical protein
MLREALHIGVPVLIPGAREVRTILEFSLDLPVTQRAER